MDVGIGGSCNLRGGEVDKDFFPPMYVKNKIRPINSDFFS